jgi:hypothetical protein
MIKLNNADHTYKSNLMRLQQRILINWTLNPKPYKDLQCNHNKMRKYINTIATIHEILLGLLMLLLLTPWPYIAHLTALAALLNLL